MDYSSGAMVQEFHPAEIRALVHTGDVLVEVRGKITLTGRMRFSDLVGGGDVMQEVFEAQITRHLPAGTQDEFAPVITLNRDRILIVTVLAEAKSGDQALKIDLDAQRVKLLCPGFEVTGFVHVPEGGSSPWLVFMGRGRFIGLTNARVTATGGEPLPTFDGLLPFCLVNRSQVQVVVGGVEAAAQAMASESAL